MTRKPYGIICPITHACAYLEPRWTLQILSEMWAGASRFNDIRRGTGNISPGLLSRRLKEMEAKGLIERVEDRATGAVAYIRTQSAIDFEPAMNALAVWAQRNIEAEVAICEPNLSSLMWKMRRWIVRDALPRRRVVMRFHFPDARSEYDTYWIIASPETEIELCCSDPKHDVDLYVDTSVLSLTSIILGRTTIAREKEAGALYLSGDALLARTMNRWLHVSDYGRAEGVLMLRQKARRAV